MVRKLRRFLRPCVDGLEDRCLLAGSGLPSGLSPTQLKMAYGINAVSFVANGSPFPGDGSGQTIAIVDAYHDPFILSDLKKFDATYGLPDPVFTEYNLAGVDNINDGWATETALDVEWSHAVAPGAKIVLVEAVNDTIPALLAAIDFARNVPGVSEVSMSFGYPENLAPGFQSYDPIFTTPAGHTGITFIASSGDSGTTGQFGGPSWPAASSHVVAVGGTTLVVNGPKGHLSESIWNGSGGGLSSVVPEPAYQYAIQTTGKRSIPDVALVADPSTGVAVYTTIPSIGQGGFEVVGGTSLSAPAWAGILAIVNEGRALNSLPSLDGPSQTLPALYALPASDFNGVAVFGPGLGLNSTVGPRTLSNTVITTGLGTPTGSLVNDLVIPPPQRPGGTPPTNVVTGPSVFGAGYNQIVGPITVVTPPKKHPRPPRRPRHHR